jgi:hypothetical protein
MAMPVDELLAVQQRSDQQVGDARDGNALLLGVVARQGVGCQPV